MTKQLGLTSARKGEWMHGWQLIDASALSTATNSFNLPLGQYLLSDQFRDVQLRIFGVVNSTQSSGGSTNVYHLRFSTDGAANTATRYFWNSVSNYATLTTPVNGRGEATDAIFLNGQATVDIGGATAPGQPGADFEVTVRDYAATNYKPFDWSFNCMGTASNAIFTEGKGRYIAPAAMQGFHITGVAGSAFTKGRWELWARRGFSPYG